jgi:hypothetical protein
MRRLCRCIFATVFSVLAISHANGQIEHQALVASKLLNSHTGWASTSHRLFFTTNGGTQWYDITPTGLHRGSYLSTVFFLDQSDGWTVMFGEDENSGQSWVDVAKTSNAGLNWTVNHVPVPQLENDQVLDGQASITFSDTLHGWLNLGIASGSNQRPGILLSTADGGITWTELRTAPPLAGETIFAETAWFAGGPGHQDLFQSADGGLNWNHAVLPIPPTIFPAIYPTYSVPIFSKNGRGLLPVSYSGPDGSASWLVVYETQSAGKSWRARNVLRNPIETTVGQPVPVSVADGVVVTAVSHQQDGKIALSFITPTDKTSTTLLDTRISRAGIVRLDFIDRTHGWVLTSDGDCAGELSCTGSGHLLSTTGVCAA